MDTLTQDDDEWGFESYNDLLPELDDAYSSMVVNNGDYEIDIDYISLSQEADTTSLTLTLSGDS